MNISTGRAGIGSTHLWVETPSPRPGTQRICWYQTSTQTPLVMESSLSPKVDFSLERVGYLGDHLANGGYLPLPTFNLSTQILQKGHSGPGWCQCYLRLWALIQDESHGPVLNVNLKLSRIIGRCLNRCNIFVEQFNSIYGNLKYIYLSTLQFIFLNMFYSFKNSHGSIVCSRKKIENHQNVPQ